MRYIREVRECRRSREGRKRFLNGLWKGWVTASEGDDDGKIRKYLDCYSMDVELLTFIC